MVMKRVQVWAVSSARVRHWGMVWASEWALESDRALVVAALVTNDPASQRSSKPAIEIAHM